MRRTRGVPTQREKEENFFVYTEETIYVMKETIHAKYMVDDLYLKFVITVTAKVETLRFDRSRRSVMPGLQGGLIGGALGRPLTAGPSGGGVSR